MLVHFCWAVSEWHICPAVVFKEMMNIFEYGDSDGVPLVLFNGTPGKGDAFAELDGIANAAHIRLICPTRPWYDDGDVLPSFAAVSTPMLAYLQRHGMSSVHVMGGSGGGPFALDLARVGGDTVASCTLLASMGMPEHFAERVTSPPTLELLKAFAPRDRDAWRETTRRWKIPDDLAEGAWGDFLVYFDELSQGPPETAIDIHVHHSLADPNAPLQSVRDMLVKCSSVTWHISEEADHIAMAADPTFQAIHTIFTRIAACSDVPHTAGQA